MLAEGGLATAGKGESLVQRSLRELGEAGTPGRRVDASLVIVKLALWGQGRKETLRKVIAGKVRKAIPLC